MPRTMFIGAENNEKYGIECTFIANNNMYFTDVKYVSDTQLSVSTNYSNGVHLVVLGMICGNL
jgi:hypothetical protein